MTLKPFESKNLSFLEIGVRKIFRLAFHPNLTSRVWYINKKVNTVIGDGFSKIGKKTGKHVYEAVGDILHSNADIKAETKFFTVVDGVYNHLTKEIEYGFTVPIQDLPC